MDRETKLRRTRDILSAAMRLIRERGQWQVVGAESVIGLDVGQISLLYRTPFQRLPPELSDLRYARARLGGKAILPYGLDIWFDRRKVLNLAWDDNGAAELISYKPGEWETALAQTAGLRLRKR